MKKTLDFKCSASPSAMKQKFDKSIPDRNRKGYIASGRSSDQGRAPRPAGILMSGMLIIGLFALAVFIAPTPVRAGEISIGVSVRIGPPPLPVYVQPVCPGPGYLWTPGYWAYDPVDGYFWVPGTWVLAPAPGLLWTPGYWGWGGAAFIWHAGYWGHHVGFYGGINYGFGYVGLGFAGGEWRGGTFFYNRSVTNISVTNITNVYNRTVVNNFAVNRVSYNGGAGGISARPTPYELAAAHERHIGATSPQRQHEMAAHNDRSQFASVNHGMPGVAATGRPGEFRGAGVVQATRAGGTLNSGEYHSANRGPANSYYGTHNAPPSSGANQAATAHAYSPTAKTSGTRPTGTASGESHSTSRSHEETSRKVTANHQAESRKQPSPQRSSHPSEGGRSEEHKAEPHR
jgi:hypothetical protein